MEEGMEGRDGRMDRERGMGAKDGRAFVEWEEGIGETDGMKGWEGVMGERDWRRGWEEEFGEADGMKGWEEGGGVKRLDEEVGDSRGVGEAFGGQRRRWRALGHTMKSHARSGGGGRRPTHAAKAEVLEKEAREMRDVEDIAQAREREREREREGGRERDRKRK